MKHRLKETENVNIHGLEKGVGHHRRSAVPAVSKRDLTDVSRDENVDAMRQIVHSEMNALRTCGALKTLHTYARFSWCQTPTLETTGEDRSSVDT